MRKLFIYILIPLLLFAGCSGVIKVPESDFNYSYKMLGMNGSRDFYYKQMITDSLKFCWSAETNGGLANTSVTVKNGAVFIGDLSGRVFSFDFKTGKEIGELKSKGAINSSIVLNDYRLFYSIEYPNAQNSSVVFYDFKNGDELKNVKLQGKITPELISDEEKIVAATREGGLYVMDFSGNQKWFYNLNCKIISSPVLFGDLVCIVSADGKLFVLDINGRKLVSTIQLNGKFEGGMVIKNGVLYCGNSSGNVYAVDLRNDKVLWQYETGFRLKSFPAIDSSTVYIANLRGEIYALDINSGRKLWKIETEGLFDATPVITSNYLIVPDQNKKYLFISKQDGKIIKTLSVEGRVKLSPVIIDNYLFIGYEKGKIAKYEFIK